MPLTRKEIRGVRQALDQRARNYSYAEVSGWLRSVGFVLTTKGGTSHRLWFHPPSGKRVGLVEKPGEIKPPYVKRAAQAILDLGLANDAPDDQTVDEPPVDLASDSGPV